jgi:hypothetical protein
MAGHPNDEDDTFCVQATKEVCFMNRDLQERGFECLVEHHDIERVTSNEDRIHILCVVTVVEDECIEVPPPSVQRSICESIAAQPPMNVVFHIGAECQRDTSDTCRCGESILCDGGNALRPNSGV